MESINELVKDEVEFCKYIDAKADEHDAYIYESKDKKSVINLPFILQEYRDWLVDNHKVKE